MIPMHSESSATSTSPTPDFSECTLVPPSSCSLMSCPVTALTSGGPASAIEPMSFTIGTKSARPGMYAVPAAPGPTIAATSGTTPDMMTSSRNSAPGAGEQREQIAVLPRLRIDARARRVDEPDHRNAVAQREFAQPRDLDLAGLPDRAALDREVVGGGADHAPVDVPVAADDRVGRRLVGAEVRHLRAVNADLEPLAVVEEAVHAARARVHLPRSCCLRIFSSPPICLMRSAALFELLDAVRMSCIAHRVIPRICLVSSTVAGVRPRRARHRRPRAPPARRWTSPSRPTAGRSCPRARRARCRPCRAPSPSAARSPARSASSSTPRPGGRCVAMKFKWSGVAGAPPMTPSTMLMSIGPFNEPHVDERLERRHVAGVEALALGAHARSRSSASGRR